MTARQLKVTSVACILFLLDSISLDMIRIQSREKLLTGLESLVKSSLEKERISVSRQVGEETAAEGSISTKI